MKRADVQGETHVLGLILKCAQEGDGASQRWLAERRWKDRWGSKTAVEVSGPGGKPHQFEQVGAPILLAVPTGLEDDEDVRDAIARANAKRVAAMPSGTNAFLLLPPKQELPEGAVPGAQHRIAQMVGIPA